MDTRKRRTRGLRRAVQLSLACAALATSLATPAAERLLPGSPTAREAFRDWLAREGRPARNQAPDAQKLAAGVKLLQARREEMRSLMERDPRGFARAAMSTAERSGLPVQWQTLVEERVKG
ncbi:MAG TPA: hypothetical protein VHI52_17405, partial [Verrucomicrobiae bacterium]|nr:hypothetical protein [Verrucomicrobiae bacterium]